MTDRFDELVGGVDDLHPRERDRLRRVHELLLEVDAPAEVPQALASAGPRIREPVADVPLRSSRSRRLRPLRERPAVAFAAAAVAALAFGSGYVVGARDVEPFAEVEMSGVGAARAGSGAIDILPQDESGNWPMRVEIRGLQPSAGRDDYYELWVTKNGRLAESCGRFTVHEGVTSVTLSVPYRLRAYDGWVVTRHGSRLPLLST